MIRPERDADYYDNLPKRAELRAEAWQEVRAPLPAWFRAPLSMSRPFRDHNGEPHETATCAEHPNWQAGGTRPATLSRAERHVREVHVGQTPTVTDPWERCIATLEAAGRG